jgi:mannose-6-phosphate isomerase-like protein (cupin superfamily)
VPTISRSSRTGTAPPRRAEKRSHHGHPSNLAAWRNNALSHALARPDRHRPLESSTAQQEWNRDEDKPSPSTPGRITARQEDKPYTHRVHNLGATPFDVLDVEILQRPAAPTTKPIAEVAAENPSARVYKYVLAPGASSAMHTHERPYLIVAATAMQLKMTAPDGKSMAHSIGPGEFHWVESTVSHTLTNEGTSEGQIIEIELK